MAKGFKIADAYAEIHVDTDELRRGASKIPGELGPEMDRAGKGMGQRLGKSLGNESTRQGNDAGGKLAVGMRMAIIRKSPLIAAAVAGALAVGAPAMLTAATGLFAGIGIVAAAQSQKVQAAWLGTWNQIKAGAISDASVIEPVLVKMAARVGSVFEQMRPQLQGAFAAAAPQIEVFTNGILKLAQNALPGLVRAVQGGMPVTQGFADFLAKVGTGLSDFFDKLTEHAPAAGQVFSALGDTMATLLPILGELLGQGAELAADVLPLLNSSLGLLLNVVDLLGPALPIVVSGLAAMKIAGAVTGGIGSLAAKLGQVAAAGGAFSGLAGKMAGGLGSIAGAAGPAGAAVGFVAATVTMWNEAASKAADMNLMLGRAFEVGGAQADAAAASLQHFAGINEFFSSGIGKSVGGISLFGHSLSDLIPSTEDAKQAYDDYVESLDKGGQAQEDVRVKTDALKQAIDEYGKGSPQAVAAADALKSAQDEAARIAGEYEAAIDGVTQAMLDQADQALRSLDAGFNYRQSVIDTKEAMARLAEVQKDSKSTQLDLDSANLAVEESLLRQASASAEALVSVSGLKEGTAEYEWQIRAQTLQALYQLRDAFPQMTPVINGMIERLEASGVSLDELGKKNPTPVVDANIDPVTAAVAGATGILTNFGLMRPTPVANLNAGPFGGVATWVHGAMDALNIRRATPVATLLANTANAEWWLNQTARNRTSYVTQIVTQVNRQVGFAVSGLTGWGGAGGGKVGDVVRGFADGGSPSRRSDGRLVGPGGPLDDLIPAITNMGEAIRVANDEWIVPGFVAGQQGDRKMAALTAGQADIVPRRFADGGSPGDRASMGDGRVVINITGTFDLASSRDLRRAATVIHSELKQIERSLS